MMADTQPETLTKYEAAVLLGVSTVTLDKWIRTGRYGRIRTAKMEGRVIVNADDVRRVKKERETVQWRNGEE